MKMLHNFVSFILVLHSDMVATDSIEVNIPIEVNIQRIWHRFNWNKYVKYRTHNIEKYRTLRVGPCFLTIIWERGQL